MFAVFILVFSGIALARFALYHWRAIWITAASQPLSDSLPAIVGLDAGSIAPRDFPKLVGLCDQVCPGLKRSCPWLKEIACYYRVVAAVETVFHSVVPAISAWAAGEMGLCTRYVAVVLDQRLSVYLQPQAALRP